LPLLVCIRRTCSALGRRRAKSVIRDVGLSFILIKPVKIINRVALCWDVIGRGYAEDRNVVNSYNAFVTIDPFTASRKACRQTVTHMVVKRNGQKLSFAIGSALAGAATCYRETSRVQVPQTSIGGGNGKKKLQPCWLW